MIRLTERQRAEQVLFIDQWMHVVEAASATRRLRRSGPTVARLEEARRTRSPACSPRSRKSCRAASCGRTSPPSIRCGASAARSRPSAWRSTASLRRLTDAAYLGIGEGSPLDEATTAILAALEDYAAEPGAMDIAERDAAQIVAALRAEGYLRGLAEHEAA